MTASNDIINKFLENIKEDTNLQDDFYKDLEISIKENNKNNLIDLIKTL
ncbi:MAG: hypothetical protein KO202_05635 [Methanobacteriaceae archaeon]|jgi:hypothetical protein|nr:hypothetical protein [Methanobacteriaceae archaeon]